MRSDILNFKFEEFKTGRLRNDLSVFESYIANDPINRPTHFYNLGSAYRSQIGNGIIAREKF